MCEDVFYTEEHDFNQEIQLNKELFIHTMLWKSGVKENRIIE